MSPTRRTFLGWTGALAGAAAGCARAQERADVVVIGAGLAGLYSALLLEEQGAKVVVLEAAARVGGRLKTLDALPGKPEAGGQTIDAMYARTIALCQRFGLELFPREKSSGDGLRINGRWIDPKDWPRAPENALPAPERETLPFRLYSKLLDAHSPLTGVGDWLAAEHAALDRRSIADEFAGKGASPEALRLISRWFDGRGMDAMSALFAYRKRQVELFGQKGAFRIRGGSQRLPEAMAAALKTPVRLQKAVIGLRADGTGVEATCTDGSRVRARRGVCALPFSVLRTIPIEPSPPPLQAQAIAELAYNSILQVKLGWSTPFYEKDGLPLSFYDDGPLQRVAAPPGQDGQVDSVNVWIRGAEAIALEAETTEAIGARVKAAFEVARPAAKDAMTVLDVTHWGKETFARGAYHHMAPGQLTRFGEAMRAPHGPLRFVGEHLATLQQGMEGAAETAEREAIALAQEL
jgi:monoamine oxidase